MIEQTKSSESLHENPLETGPQGTGDHVVVQGECLESIAARYGHIPDTIWVDPGNRGLRDARQERDALLPLDRIAIPPLRERHENAVTEQRHCFMRKAVPARLRVVFHYLDEPRANEPYRVVIDGKMSEGMLDAEGLLDLPISPEAEQATVWVGEEEAEYELCLGYANPVSETTGLQSRLNNLGFDCGRVDGALGPKTEMALQLFQEKHGLEVTARPNDMTKDRLLGEHGS